MAALYFADAVHQLVFSPDRNGLNSLKTGIQQGLQVMNITDHAVFLVPKCRNRMGLLVSLKHRQ